LGWLGLEKESFVFEFMSGTSAFLTFRNIRLFIGIKLIKSKRILLIIKFN
jgi:hypothetical protein